MVQGYPRRGAPLTAGERGERVLWVQQVQLVQLGAVRRIKTGKRRRILVALRAYRHLERSLQIFLAEQSTC